MNLDFLVYCPACGALWNGWGEDVSPRKCFQCGFDRETITRMSEPKIEVIPESCPDHPKYKAIGKPATDCRTCWLMYKASVDKQAEEVINER